jgi:hypothetical protein
MSIPSEYIRLSLDKSAVGDDNATLATNGIEEREVLKMSLRPCGPRDIHICEKYHNFLYEPLGNDTTSKVLKMSLRPYGPRDIHICEKYHKFLYETLGEDTISFPNNITMNHYDGRQYHLTVYSRHPHPQPTCFLCIGSSWHFSESTSTSFQQSNSQNRVPFTWDGTCRLRPHSILEFV